MKYRTGPYPLGRCVSPRRPIHDDRPIIATDSENVLLERTGEIFPVAQLPFILLSEPSSLLVCERASAMLVHLNETYVAKIRGWQYRVAPVARRVYRPHRRRRPTETRDVIVSFLGWRFSDRKTHYHYPLDPLVFTGKNVRAVVKVSEEPNKLAALLKWGQDVRAWCQDNGLKVSPGTGALGAQLLKDPRFYPERRRKVPMATNERARHHLPGNFYELYTAPKRYHEAYYVDMRAAHHHCAAGLEFPCANGLLARGRWRNPPDSLIGLKCWAPKGGRAYERLIHSYGLLLVRLTTPANVILKGSFVPPYMRKPGQSLAWVYTNEVPFIESLGGIIEGIEAGYTSFRRDTGLNKYAKWALTEIDGMPDERRRWAKPVMLAAYGMLAARPVQREYGYRYTVGGEPHVYMTSGGPLQCERQMQSKMTEAPIVNVIHRGMIEAQVRAEALALARQFYESGTRVLCVYADSVIVDATGPVPLVPAPWSIKSPLSRLEFFNPTSFHSVEMTRLPGIPLEGRHRIARLNSLRALNTWYNRGEPEAETVGLHE